MVQVKKDDLLEVIRPVIQLVRINAFGLLAGPVAFLAVIIYLVKSMENGQNPDLPMMYYSHFILLVVLVIVSMVLEKVIFRKFDSTEKFLLNIGDVLRTAVLIKLALLEGAALFGLVILFLGKTAGILEKEHHLWYVLISLVVLAFNIIPILFRSEDGFVEYIKEKSDIQVY